MSTQPTATCWFTHTLDIFIKPEGMNIGDSKEEVVGRKRSKTWQGHPGRVVCYLHSLRDRGKISEQLVWTCWTCICKGTFVNWWDSATVAIPYLNSLWLNCILQSLGVEKMYWPASSPDLNPFERWVSAWTCCLSQSDKHNHVRWLVWDAGWRMGCHSATACDRVDDEHEQEVPGCYGCLYLLHTLLRLMFVIYIHF